MSNNKENNFYTDMFFIVMIATIGMAIKFLPHLPRLIKRIIFSPMYIGQHFRDKKLYRKSDYKDVIPYSKRELKQDKGKWGEYLLFKDVQRILPKSRILPNVYIPGYNNQTTEIDLIAVDKTGIYVFESKNYKAKLKGYSQDVYLTYIKGRTREEVYNPLLQNKKHVDHLSEYLGIEREKMHSMVMFHKAFLDIKGLKDKKLNFNSNILQSWDINLKVLSNKYPAITKVGKGQTLFTTEEVNIIAEKLKETAGINTSPEIRAKHISQIENFNRKKETKEINKMNIDPQIQLQLQQNEIEILKLKNKLRETETSKDVVVKKEQYRELSL